MKQYLAICAFFLFTLSAPAQDGPKSAVSKLGPNPVIMVDSQKVSQSDVSRYSADSIATLTILLDTSAIKRYGVSAKDGAVIIETRSFARRQFISYFRQASQVFDSLYKATGTDTAFAYIINDKLQEGSYEGNLSAVTDELFIGLEILTKEQLYSKYNIADKQFGILIHSKKPKDLYNADKKF